MFFSKKAQGALEYLLMIGAVILILAVVVVVLTSVVVEGDSEQDVKNFSDHLNELRELHKGQDKQPIDSDSQAVIYSFKVSGVSGFISGNKVEVKLPKDSVLEGVSVKVIGVYGSIESIDNICNFENPSEGVCDFELNEEFEFKVSSENLDYNKSYFVKVTYKEDGGGDDTPSEPDPDGPDVVEIVDCINFGANPIPICTLSDLDKVREKLDGTYVLKNDINASETKKWNEGAGWEPIGSDHENFFSGVFDGNNHKITNLFIDRPNRDWIGLFGYADGAEIKNIGLVDINVSGDSEVGGLIGWNYSSSVSSSYSVGSVSGGSYVGGLIGGGAGDGWFSVINSFASGSVSGSSNVGGLMGYKYSGSVSDSYSVGSVSGGSYVGGLIGYEYSGSVSDSYWDITLCEINNGIGEGKTTSQMKQQNTFSGWNFGPNNPVWTIVEGKEYPKLAWQTN